MVTRIVPNNLDIVSRIVFDNNLDFVETVLEQAEDRKKNVEILLDGYTETGDFDSLATLIQNQQNIFGDVSDKWNLLYQDSQHVQLDPEGYLHARIVTLSRSIQKSHSLWEKALLDTMRDHEEALSLCNLIKTEETSKLNNLEAIINLNLRLIQQPAIPPRPYIDPTQDPRTENPEIIFKAQNWLSRMKYLDRVFQNIAERTTQNRICRNDFVQLRNWRKLTTHIQKALNILDEVADCVALCPQLNQDLDLLPSQIKDNRLISYRVPQQKRRFTKLAEIISRDVTILYDKYAIYLSESETASRDKLRASQQRITTALSQQPTNTPSAPEQKKEGD